MRKASLISSVASAALVAGGWLWAYFALRNLATPIVLHFTNYSGIDRIGTILDIHRIGALGALIVLINGALGWTLRERSPGLAAAVGLATFFFSLLLFILFAAIIGVN